MIYVFDSSALIAYLQNEPGVEVVDNLLKDTANDCYAHAANLCEVYYDFLRVSNDPIAYTLIESLYRARVQPREDMDTAFWRQIGRDKGTYQCALGDCFGLVLARRLGGQLITADHHEMDAVDAQESGRILFIR